MQWPHVAGVGCNPVSETAPQTSAVLPASPLGACIKESGSSYPSETHPARSSSSMVVGQEVHTGRDVVRHSIGSGAAIYRCVRVRLGSPYEHTSGKRSIGLYRDVWIAAIASSRKSLATQTAAICVRFQGSFCNGVFAIRAHGLRGRPCSTSTNWR